MAEVLALAEARALAGEERAVFVRIAEAEGRVYLDLADPAWRAVEVDATGWRVVPRAPVRFRRAAGMLPLPEPTRGGTVDELRPFVNVENDRDWRLVVGGLVMAFSSRGPYPVVVTNGEHGSGKSWTAGRLRDMVDPNEAPSRSEPREPRDLAIAARNGWILSFDNISSLPGWLSDGLCRLATGSGFATRELYSDEDEVLFTAMRPIIVNGIGEVVTRPDLLDRALLLTLPPIPEERRRDERELLRAFAAVRPRVLGALLDAVSAAIRNRDGIALDHVPRLADFARWVSAAEPGLGWPAGAFMEAYTVNRSEAHELALDGPIAAALRSLMTEMEIWEGTAAELLAVRGPKAAEPIVRRLREAKPAILAFLAPDPELARRVVAFRAQVERWTHARRSGVPILALPGVASRPGTCLSCGEPLCPGRTYRCAPCVAAVEAVLGLPPVLGA